MTITPPVRHHPSVRHVCLTASEPATWSVLGRGCGLATGVYTGGEQRVSFTCARRARLTRYANVDAAITIKEAPARCESWAREPRSGDRHATKRTSSDAGRRVVAFFNQMDANIQTSIEGLRDLGSGRVTALPSGHSGDWRDLSSRYAFVNSHARWSILRQGFSAARMVATHSGGLTDGHVAFGKVNQVNIGGDTRPDGASTAILPDGVCH